MHVFVLGAGFSYALADIPLMSGVGKAIDKFVQSENDASVLAKLAVARAEFDSTEEWLSCLADPDVWLGQTKYKASTMLVEEITEFVAEHIFDDQSKTVPYESRAARCPPMLINTVKHMVKAGRNEGCIFSLNYDTLVERAFNEINEDPYAYRRMLPFQVPLFESGHHRQDAPALLKLHGSLNWFHRNSEVIDVGVQNVGCKPDSGNWFNHLFHHAPGFGPLVIPPTAAKNNLINRGILKQAWQVAAALIKDATKITFIGYSMPNEDGLLQRLISLGKNAEFTVVDPFPDSILKRLSDIGVKLIHKFESIDTYLDSATNNYSK